MAQPTKVTRGGGSMEYCVVDNGPAGATTSGPAGGVASPPNQSGSWSPLTPDGVGRGFDEGIGGAAAQGSNLAGANGNIPDAASRAAYKVRGPQGDVKFLNPA